MELQSLNFLFIFLPLFLLVFILSTSIYRKWIIILASLFYYFLLSKQNTFLILILIGINYYSLRLIKKYEEKPRTKRTIFLIAVVINIGLLIFYKLIFIQGWNNTEFVTITNHFNSFSNLSYPVGLSFIIFTILSSLFDIYNNSRIFPKDFSDYLAYVLFFPKLTVGPIVRFNQFDSQLNNLEINWQRLADGVKRFIRGLAKKIIIADQLAIIVNAGFGLEKPAFSSSVAWVLLIALFLQMYYDFSGIIDMVLGIAHMIGFDLPENFNTPYLARNLSEFWRRWHITLLNWFRDYVFYPLEFKRRRVKTFRIESHTILVFILTGLWHGISINFLIWGLIQSIILIFENSRYGRWIKSVPEIFQHIYLIIVVMLSWVFFRSPTIGYSLRFIKRLFILDENIQLYPFSISLPIPIINNSVYLVIILGILGIIFSTKAIQNLKSRILTKSFVIGYIVDFSYVGLLIISIAYAISQSFTPSIYGRF
jgi:alginate O-acetyltransferase complex protein AlgI